jgi:hypothetical protein
LVVARDGINPDVDKQLLLVPGNGPTIGAGLKDKRCIHGRNVHAKLVAGQGRAIGRGIGIGFQRTVGQVPIGSVDA